MQVFSRAWETPVQRQTQRLEAQRPKVAVGIRVSGWRRTPRTSLRLQELVGEMKMMNQRADLEVWETSGAQQDQRPGTLIQADVKSSYVPCVDGPG